MQWVWEEWRERREGILGRPHVAICTWTMCTRCQGVDFSSCQIANHSEQALHETGILAARDPRVSEDENNKFLNMMERYYAQELEKKMQDVAPS